MYDAAIIGTGPAGLSAALCLKLHEKNLIWFGSPAMSAKVEKSEKIANYPGAGLVSGEELNARFRAHAEAMGLTPVDQMVTSIMPTRDYFTVLANNEIYEAKTLLLATGVVSGKGFPGEQEYLGRGVSYCATCDGFLYKGKRIAVFCGGKRFEHEVRYLAEIAERVYLFAGYPDCAVDAPNVEKIPAIREVRGGLKLTSLALADGREIEVSALFCLRGAVAPATLLPGLEMDGAHIVVNRRQETSVPGCYAAGDCTGRPYQLTKAVGEGNVAAHEMLERMES